VGHSSKDALCLPPDLRVAIASQANRPMPGVGRRGATQLPGRQRDARNLNRRECGVAPGEVLNITDAPLLLRTQWCTRCSPRTHSRIGTAVGLSMSMISCRRHGRGALPLLVCICAGAHSALRGKHVASEGCRAELCVSRLPTRNARGCSKLKRRPLGEAPGRIPIVVVCTTYHSPPPSARPGAQVFEGRIRQHAAGMVVVRGRGT